MNNKLILGDTLTNVCFNVLKLSFDNELNLVQNGTVLEWDEFESIDIDNPVPYKDDKIDAILIFGDGTIEFHLQTECDALCWSDFEDELVKEVIRRISNEHSNNENNGKPDGNIQLDSADNKL